ncbi:MAG: hypothetical protein DI565_07325 [Ancylobacter novellus]|uniref:PBP domain-containing protein n=1 Tax=Ancylobacter novellus TaxID=921 RepID=A0A2W5MHX3_ANCNO|nr:MAG: hypothetical protein DI565_07325 [Ancylobacter novellus]
MSFQTKTLHLHTRHISVFNVSLKRPKSGGPDPRSETFVMARGVRITDDKGFKMSHLFRLAGASALALFAAAPAFAQETIRGQGATLPAGLYADWFNPGPNAAFSYSYNAALIRPSGGSIPANTGSGAGKASFENHMFNNNTWFPGGSGTPAQPLPSDVTTAQKEDIQFAGSDAILTTADLDTYNAARWGDPIQVPSVGTPVTLAFNKASLTLKKKGPTGLVDGDGKQVVGKILYLSRASYCGIFTGGISRWNDPLIVRDNGKAPSNQEIKVVVRSDSSGTTEIFSRHLDTVCDGSAAAGGFSFPSTNSTDPSQPTGKTTIAWSDLIPSGRLIPAAGSGGVSTAIANNAFAIGYVSPDYTDLIATPAAGAGSPAPSTANLQNQFDIDNGTFKNYKRSASWSNVDSAMRSMTPPAVTDSALVWGQKLAILDPVVNNPTQKNAYPIVGFTFLNFYTCYPNSKIAGVKSFAEYVFSKKSGAKARAGGFTPLSTSFRNAVNARLFATGTSPRGLSKGKISGYCSL